MGSMRGNTGSGVPKQVYKFVRRRCVISMAALLTKDCIASYQADTPNPIGKLIPAQGSVPAQTLSGMTGMRKPSSEWRA